MVRYHSPIVSISVSPSPAPHATRTGQSYMISTSSDDNLWNAEIYRWWIKFKLCAIHVRENKSTWSEICAVKGQLGLISVTNTQPRQTSYVYTYIYIHINIYVCFCTYIYIFMHPYIHTHKCTLVHKLLNMYSYIHMYTYAWVKCVYIYVFMYTHIYTRTAFVEKIHTSIEHLSARLGAWRKRMSHLLDDLLLTKFRVVLFEYLIFEWSCMVSHLHLSVSRCMWVGGCVCLLACACVCVCVYQCVQSSVVSRTQLHVWDWAWLCMCICVCEHFWVFVCVCICFAYVVCVGMCVREGERVCVHLLILSPVVAES